METTELNLDKARVPGRMELALRNNVVWQAIRFAVINLKMLSMITKGHTPEGDH
jgi:hypothetical protein